MIKKLRVDGMSCQNCVRRVRKIIEESDGVSDVTVSMETKEAVFSYRPETDIGAILQAIQDFGFAASEKP